jgi:hypothetical protein
MHLAVLPPGMHLALIGPDPMSRRGPVRPRSAASPSTSASASNMTLRLFSEEPRPLAQVFPAPPLVDLDGGALPLSILCQGGRLRTGCWLASSRIIQSVLNRRLLACAKRIVAPRRIELPNTNSVQRAVADDMWISTYMAYRLPGVATHWHRRFTPYQCQHFAAGYRRTEVVPLYLMATEVSQQTHLLGCFGPFRHD